MTADQPTPGATFRRLHDASAIEAILQRDGFDAPIRYFSPSLLRVAVREVLAPSDNVYFVTAEVRGKYAGFTLAHTLGPTLWRKFAREQAWKHPLALSWLIVRLRLIRPMELRLRRLVAGRQSSHERSTVPPPDVPALGRPFAKSPYRFDLGQLDQIFVAPDFRGLGIAPGLIRLVESEMAARNITLIEAHVDAGNVASLKAFLKAGWTAYRASGGDYYVCCRPVPTRSG